MTLRRKPLTLKVLRGLDALVKLGAADLEGEDVRDWFPDVHPSDVESAVAWLTRERNVRGLLARRAKDGK